MVEPLAPRYEIPIENYKPFLAVLHSAGFNISGTRIFHAITEVDGDGVADYRPEEGLVTTDNFPALDKFLLELDLESL